MIIGQRRLRNIRHGLSLLAFRSKLIKQAQVNGDYGFVILQIRIMDKFITRIYRALARGDKKNINNPRRTRCGSNPLMQRIKDGNRG